SQRTNRLLVRHSIILLQYYNDQYDRSTGARFPVFKNRQLSAEQFLIDSNQPTSLQLCQATRQAMLRATAHIDQNQGGAGRHQQDGTNAAESAHARPYCACTSSRKSRSRSRQTVAGLRSFLGAAKRGSARAVRAQARQ